MSELSAALVGSTGLVGSNILLALASNNAFSSVHALSRRALPSYANVTPVIREDSNQWPTALSGLKPTPAAFFSALGTTRAQAGGFDKQRLIDYDLNLELAKQAHAAGSRVYVLISTSGASSSSMFGYTKMKGQLEDEVQKIGFEHTIILRPGLLLGQRSDLRIAEATLQGIAKMAGRISKPVLTDFWAQDAGEVARAAVKASEMCIEGKKEKGVWVVGQSEIVELARSA